MEIKVTYLVQIQIYHWLEWTTEPLDETQPHQGWPEHLICMSEAQICIGQRKIYLIFAYQYAIEEV